LVRLAVTVGGPVRPLLLRLGSRVAFRIDAGFGRPVAEPPARSAGQLQVRVSIGASFAEDSAQLAPVQKKWGLLASPDPTPLLKAVPRTVLQIRFASGMSRRTWRPFR
jgi:hypothetical protein